MAEKTSAEEELSRAELADRLHELADALDEGGSANVRVGNKTVTLHPVEALTYEIDVREQSTLLGGNRESIDLKVGWRPDKE